MAEAACAGDVAPYLEVGSGETHFESVETDEPLRLVAGSQGGYHVWLSMRTRGLRGPRMRMDLALTPDGPARATSSTVYVTFSESGEVPGVLERVGWPAQLRDPWCAVDYPVLIEVTLTDDRGRSASDAMQVVPTEPRGGFSQACEVAP